MNGDSRLDLIASITAANSVSVFINQPSASGAFSTATTYANVASFPVRLVVKDVNGDARPDIILAMQQGAGVGIMLNSATSPGTFLPLVSYATLGDPRTLAIGDVNSDGRPDVVALNLTDGTVGVLLNSAAAPGTFPKTATIYPAGGANSQGIALGDVNGDGRLDLVVGGGGSGSVGVLLNRSALPGTFAPAVSYDSGGSYPQDVAVGDVNGDGRADIVVATGNSGSVGILLNSATTPGTFPGKATTYSTGDNGAYSVVLGDVNGDRHPDIVTGNYNTSAGTASVGVFVNSETSPGTFPAVCTNLDSGGTSTHDVAVGDVDGDGRLDIAAVNFASSTAAILRNKGTYLTTAVPSTALVRLYPNPAHNQFTLELARMAGAASLEVELFNGLGQVVFRQQAPLSVEGTRLLVDTKDLLAGVYTLRMHAGTTLLTRRIVVH
ncbi:T9SS type A sorting domain-containing protein [Hymenobacter sp. BT683]|uniref:T9SS type A sorting domain-containing protein n=1 Tax=Hymenobacter jeongseonensis TaxID=2791027 RepID=A0ABS0IMF9_9BACT|nr:T9SS type A sorting domain-containing protein [Hymenobacter jeongseonensis]MBF9239542.1 T9SS type A sorting domain-containing protein [Hymenobacter jeongseonensis]